MSAPAPSSAAALEGPVWDPVVRLVHWGLAAAVLLNGLITEGGKTPHVWIGWAAFSLVALRLVWGLVGPAEARFSAFPPSLSAARAHLADLAAGRRTPSRSHNPLGSLMVYALWATFLATAATGIAMAGGPFAEREAAAAPPVAAALADEDDDHDRRGYEAAHEEDEDEDEALEELHEAAANLLLLLAALHVAGVALESRRFGVDLVRPMIDGRRREP